MRAVPRPPSSLIGRESDLVRTLDRLSTARWMTLTGLGDVGKTRIALALGAILEDGGGSVGYCDAVGLRSIAELSAAMAHVLDLDPRRKSAPAMTSTLIVDNLEHLAPAAGDALVDWLSRTPALRLLVTSRLALSRPEELVVPVLPIDAATPDSPAVTLLMARSNTRGDRRPVRTLGLPRSSSGDLTSEFPVATVPKISSAGDKTVQWTDVAGRGRLARRRHATYTYRRPHNRWGILARTRHPTTGDHSCVTLPVDSRSPMRSRPFFSPSCWLHAAIRPVEIAREVPEIPRPQCAKLKQRRTTALALTAASLVRMTARRSSACATTARESRRVRV
jgi:hypothetical protein